LLNWITTFVGLCITKYYFVFGTKHFVKPTEEERRFIGGKSHLSNDVNINQSGDKIKGPQPEEIIFTSPA